jgi:hypothetical protein
MIFLSHVEIYLEYSNFKCGAFIVVYLQNRYIISVQKITLNKVEYPHNVGVGELSRDAHSRSLARRWGGRAVAGSGSCRFVLGAVVGLSRSSSSPHIWGSLVFLRCCCRCDCLGVVSSSWSWFSCRPLRPGCPAIGPHRLAVPLCCCRGTPPAVSLSCPIVSLLFSIVSLSCPVILCRCQPLRLAPAAPIGCAPCIRGLCLVGCWIR